MTAVEDIATEQWTVEPYASDEIAMHIKSGPHRILRNVNLEDDEMTAITALPELFALAMEVAKGCPDAADWEDARGRLAAMANAAIQKATDNGITTAMSDLAAAVDGAFDGVDADAYVRALRDDDAPEYVMPDGTRIG